MASPSPTTSLGSQEPTWLHEAPFTASYGPLVGKVAAASGMPLFEWQQASSTGALACSETGDFLHRTVVRIIPRQNGKNNEVESIQIVKLLMLRRPLQVHSAHKVSTAKEHYRRVKRRIQKLQKVDPSVAKLSIQFRESNEDRSIECHDFGTRLVFLARATGGGRGFTGDDLYLDEALFLTEEMIGDILPAMSAVPNAQIFYLSSHPKPESRTPLLKTMRNGRAGTGTNLSYREWGNEYVPSDEQPLGVDLEDREALLRVNPSFGVTIGDVAVGNEREEMSAREFARERYGCVDLREDSAGWSVFPRAAWSELADPASKPGTVIGLGIDMPPDMSTAVVALASTRPDGRVHVELMRRDYSPDDWLEEKLVEWSQELKPAGIGYESGSAVSASARSMRRLRRRLMPLSNRDIGVATSLVRSKVRDQQIVHLGDPVLTGALKAAQLGKLTESMSRLTKRNTVDDISPAIAMANALYVLETNGRPERSNTRRGVVVMK